MRSIRSLVLICGLFRIAWIDGRERRIPNRILFILFLIRGILLALECFLYREGWNLEWCLSVGGFFVGGGMALLVYLLFRGGLGAGDVKLLAVIGCYLGSEKILRTVFFSIFYAAFYSVIMLMLKKTDLKQEIPFGPFIFLGVITVMV